MGSPLTIIELASGASLLDPGYLISALGPYVLLGLCLIVFAECGLLVGFFLPGDSLLFTAGLFVHTGLIRSPLWLVCLLLVTSALLGNVCGYWIGRKAGPAIFHREDSRLFKRQHVDRTHAFFEKYGARAIVLGRFVPVVRTFITVMAGVGQMNARHYLTYSFVGGIAWAGGVTVLGYLLGGFAFARDNIELMILGVVVLSVIPLVLEFLKARRERCDEHRAIPEGS
ncbi:MAG TPA: VTT domain-containing protein [Pseudonocardia sp.]